MQSNPGLHNDRNSTAADRHPGTETFHKISLWFLSWFIAVIQLLILRLVRGQGASHGLTALSLSLVRLSATEGDSIGHLVLVRLVSKYSPPVTFFSGNSQHIAFFRKALYPLPNIKAYYVMIIKFKASVY